MFDKKEIDWLKEIVEDKIVDLKENYNQEYAKIDLEILNNILSKLSEQN